METLIQCLTKRVDNQRAASCVARAQRNKTSIPKPIENRKKQHSINRLLDYVLPIGLDIEDPLV